MYMGGQEMKGVLERDNLTIKNNLKKVRETNYFRLYACANLFNCKTRVWDLV
jgi:hypothetical protein